MRLTSISVAAGSMFLAAMMTGCGSAQVVDREASTSAIRAAEEAGASNVASASLFLQLAKEEMEHAKRLAASGDKEEAEGMLLRAQADAELAIALSRGDADKVEAAKAIERVRLLREENQLPQKRN